MAAPKGLTAARSGTNTRGLTPPPSLSSREDVGRKGGAERVMRAVTARVVSGRSRRRPTELGQGLVEYGLILVLIAIVAIVSLIFLGGTLSNMISNVGSSV